MHHARGVTFLKQAIKVVLKGVFFFLKDDRVAGDDDVEH